MAKGVVSLSATKWSEIELITSPSRVRVFVDGAFYSDGRYLTTPVVIRVAPGKRKLTAKRPGYQSNSSLVITSNENDRPTVSMTLEPANTGFQEISIEKSSDADFPDIEVSVDGGQEVGDLPLTVTDLLPGTHHLEITLGKIIKKTVTCRFEIKPEPFDNITKISLEMRGKRLRIDGCKQVK
jgi:hypothetical protein